MPIYEYQCVTCDAVTDIKHGFMEKPTQACPACGGLELKRLFNAAGIVFKGSGFYVTDSRKASGSGAAAGATPKGDSAAKTDASSDGSGGKADAAPKADSAAKTETPSKTDSAGKGDAAA